MAAFVDSIAPERFAKYLLWCNSDVYLAHRLYDRNVALAEVFFTPLHVLEIVLRNRVDDTLRKAYSDWWYDDPAVVVGHFARQRVLDAQRKLGSQATHVTRGQMVAELSFGFWTGMFNRQQSHLWGRLQPIFVGATGLQRRSVSGQLDDIRGLRNRIAHHEAIVQLDLMKYYKAADTITR